MGDVCLCVRGGWGSRVMNFNCRESGPNTSCVKKKHLCLNQLKVKVQSR